MSPLEIVLTSVLGGLVLVSIFYVLIFSTNKNNRLETFVVINQQFEPEAIVFFGDSLTEFYPIQDFFPRHTIYNRGIAGDTTNDLLRRIDNVIALKPRKIFIQIGTNDLGKGCPPKKILANIEKIYTILQSSLPGVELVAISLYPVSHHKMWLSPVITGLRSNKNIRKLNQMLITLCQKMNIKYIDIHQHLVDKKGRIDRELTLEGLHISGKGYGVITGVLRDYL